MTKYNVKHIVFPARHLEEAKKFFGAFLGTEPYADAPFYVGYKVGDMEVGLDPNGTDVITYTDTDDIESRLKELVATGATIEQEPKDVANGLLIAKVKDPNGNMLGLRQGPK